MLCYLESADGSLIPLNRVMTARPFAIGDSWFVKVTLSTDILGEGVEKFVRGCFAELSEAARFIHSVWGFDAWADQFLSVWG